jgi:hypothetical protein
MDIEMSLESDHNKLIGKIRDLQDRKGRCGVLYVLKGSLLSIASSKFGTSVFECIKVLYYLRETFYKAAIKPAIFKIQSVAFSPSGVNKQHTPWL